MSIQELDEKLAGASRQNRFRILLPSDIDGDVAEFNILVQSTNVPGKTRGAITINKNGKTARIAGDDVSDETFPCNVFVPKDAKKTYKLIQDWYKLSDEDDGYKKDIIVEQLSLQNEVTAAWKITGCWVSTLPPVNFDETAMDTLQTFEATFTLDDVELID